jgi:hypothetical protein
MKTNLANWLSALCAVLLVVLLVLQAKQKSELETIRLEHQAFASVTEQHQQEARDALSRLADQVATLGTNLESRLEQGEQQAYDKMGATMSMVQQNTAVMHRALGKVIPVELPEALTNQLAALEAHIADENAWPKDSTEADAMLVDLSALVKQIPAWAEEDYLPRLNALRWAVQSFQVLQANRNAESNALETAADAYANQLSIQPTGGSTNIAAELTSRQQEATAEFTVFRRESAINDAMKQLNLKPMTDGLSVWQHLAEWTNDPTVGPNALELRQQLHSRLLDDEIVNYNAYTKVELVKLDAVTNNALRQAGYLRTLENVTVQRLRLLQEADAPPSSVNELADLSAIIETRIKDESDRQRQDEAGRERGYQSWALGEIADFRSDFEYAQQQTRQVKGWFGHTNTETYTDYGMIRNAVGGHLLHISPGYLDTAVAMIYRQAFDDGMNKLDGNLQLEVAKEDAKMPKKTPQNYLENKP